MTELHRLADKLLTDAKHLQSIAADPSEEAVELGLSIAKRVRRNSNLLVRQYAVLRDSYSPKEGTSE